MNKMIRLFKFLLLLFISFLIICSFLAPYFEVKQNVIAFKFVNHIPSRICNQYPTHSLYIFGSNIGLCARCQFIYLSFLIFIIFSFFYSIKPENPYYAILGFTFLIPMIVDGCTQLYGIRTSTNILRATTGFFGGIGISFLLVSAKSLTFTINNHFKKRRD